MHNFEIGKIDPSARISNSAKIGNNVTIGHSVTIYDNVEIGDNTIIGPYCSVGEPLNSYYEPGETYINPPLKIGKDSLLRSYSLLYAGSTLEDNFECGHRVTIRENTHIGRNVRIGTLSDIQGDCSIGKYTRLHSNVHVGQKSKIEDFVWIFPYAVLTNDPHPPSNSLKGVTVEEFAVIATKVVILPGITIGKDALIGASALVRANVPQEAVFVGNPAKQVATIHDIKNRETGQKIYPWRESFDRGMPWEGIGYQAWESAQKL